MLSYALRIGLLLAFAAPAFANDCLPISEAQLHVGKMKCITGKVLKVTSADSGTHFLNFCDDYRVCPFQVVVFRSDLKHVGDVRSSKGASFRFTARLKTTMAMRKSF